MGITATYIPMAKYPKTQKFAYTKTGILQCKNARNYRRKNNVQVVNLNSQWFLLKTV